MINYQELKKIGLSDKEAKIYLTSLSRGPETAPNLAKIAAIVRPTAYVIIDSLIKKGLMSSYDQDKKTYFTAEAPEHLLSLLRMQMKEIEQKEREIEKLIPELMQIANIKGEKPKVRVFEGKEGLQSIREILVKIKSKMVYSFVPYDDVFDLFSEKEHSETVTQKRISKGIRSKVFYTSKKGPLLKSNDSTLLREARFVSEKLFPFKAGIDVYDNYVALYTFKGKIMGIFIENDDVARTMKSVFEMLWENTGQKHKQ